MKQYQQAAALLPVSLRRLALAADRSIQTRAEEIRLRSGQRLSALLPEGETVLSEKAVEQEQLEQTLDLVSGYSRYAVADTLRRGFVMASGGFRIGICGSAVMEGGRLSAIKELQSLSIRIPREQKGIAKAVLQELWPEGRVESALVVGPPGTGKTTFLRDAVRCLSDDYALRVALADERGELAAVCRGVAQLDVGQLTDVMTLCPKEQAISLLLRSMNPQVIAVDEVVQPSDIEAMEQAAHSGAILLASVHGYDLTELKRKPLFASLLSGGIFRKAVLIARNGTKRTYRVEEIG